ncbi:hypothetical protein CVT25_003582 [Psilocybe cyanescens]|uniref:CFEM domain-containing protein n=1 Tax=Psilocybe cyanescens TaxID=93625 RepID=A0A409X6M4_PSICY|nr:hypothetical protein CVT25_003582 [Psilocybe cyanescens]
MFSTFSFLFFLQILLPVWSSVSLIPPSTFPSASPSSTSSGSTTSSTTNVSSRSSSSSASVTSTQFPPLTTYTPCGELRRFDLRKNLTCVGCHDIPIIVTNCLAIAIARVNCTSIVDVNCFCVKTEFPAELVGCIQSDCPEQLGTAENLAQQFCNIASASPSLSFSPTSSFSSSTSSVSSSSTSTAPSTSTSSSNTSGAWNLAINRQEIVLGFGMSILGVVSGAYTLW